jgi:hypothetical protein
MTARRVINWVISISAGLISTIIVLQLFGTTLGKFSLGNALMVFIATGAIVFVWLDWILKTDYLRH